MLQYLIPFSYLFFPHFFIYHKLYVAIKINFRYDWYVLQTHETASKAEMTLSSGQL